MVRIAAVTPGSIADSLELRIGTRIVTVNGARVRDGLDFAFLTADGDLELEAVDPDGNPVVYEIEREPDEGLGIVPDQDKIRECANECVFCFIDGNPPDARPPLWVRDDDFRLSFTYGSYVTLTNLGPRGLQRLVDQRITPLYVSVHSTTPETRIRLLKNDRAGLVTDQLRTLLDGGLQVHTQVVLCPEWNDREDLDRTLDDLYGLGEDVLSMSVVPVGLTRYNVGRPVRLLTPDEAVRALSQVDRIRQRSLAERGKGWCYGADELFLLAGRSVPDAGYYDGWPLLENGVGSVRSLLDDFETGAPRLEPLEGVTRVRVVTGHSMASFFRQLAPRIASALSCEVEVVPVENGYFGSTVTIAGLLSGEDILRTLGGGVGGGPGAAPRGGAERRRRVHRRHATRPRGGGVGSGTRADGTRAHRGPRRRMSLPVVAIVGRPNVGKSTFFNRAIGRRMAIVADVPGVTRDRNFAQSDWTGTPFFVVDTGGVVEDPDEPMDRLVRQQAYAAMDEADVILLLTDAKTGVHPLDQKLAEVLRKSPKPVLLVANKVDNLPTDTSHLDFWELGLGEPHPVSAISGRGIGDLFDHMVPLLPEPGPGPAESDIRVAVVGKPNVGKSSLVNRLFGEERMVVSEVAGTTRDPVDLPFTYHGKNLVFVDTAGLRRHARIDSSVEYYSSLRTARVVRRADVCLVLVDAADGMSVQDIKVAESAWEAGSGVIVVCNKWDLVEKETNTAAELQRTVSERAPFLKAVPFAFVSALTGQRVRKLLDLVVEVDRRRRHRVDTHEVNEVVRALVQRQPPPHARGRPVKIKYATQADVEPPTFVLFSNLPGDVPRHYERYLMNGFRAAWDFEGCPIRLRLRKSAD